jgi:hypothetical protein
VEPPVHDHAQHRFPTLLNSGCRPRDSELEGSDPLRERQGWRVYAVQARAVDCSPGCIRICAVGGVPWAQHPIDEEQGAAIGIGQEIKTNHCPTSPFSGSPGSPAPADVCVAAALRATATAEPNYRLALPLAPNHIKTLRMRGNIT